ncbi:MAG: hypothetical protein WCC11_03515 [Gammaproteobacteria bacterium]
MLDRAYVAADALLIQEAGGLVGGFNGTLGMPENGDILTGGEKIYAAMAEEFKTLTVGS